MEASRMEDSQISKLYDHSGAKISAVWKYFGFIKAKDGPTAKTNLDTCMSKAIYTKC